jgi:pimeloyl-ACP methyl ester carboxylesterase
MEALLKKGLQPYCMDFRGFGGTPHDETKCVEPNRCVEDAESVLRWIAARHGLGEGAYPALLGWSQGALVAQLAAQKPHPQLSKLVLYGSIYDPLVRYAREPLYASKQKRTRVPNSFDDAIEDFTLEGTIPPDPAKNFAYAALISDPIKAQWIHTYQFNNCDPARIHVPTLVIAGDQDPYAPLHVQQELFTNLGRGCDRTWSILSNCDHAVHLLEGRDRMINIVVSFIQNGKATNQQ